MKWFYVIDGRREGPIEEPEFLKLAREGRIRPSDWVWNETMGDKWAPASTVPGLFAAEPPPLAVPAVSAAVVLAERPASEEGPSRSVYEARRISCTEPTGEAWERMKKLLFTPFDIGKWFLLGFSAWLAYLGEGGGSFNLNDDMNWAKGEGGAPVDWSGMLERAQEFFRENMGMIVGIGGSVLLIATVIGLALLWVRCRGKFMFLDNAVHNRSLISEPWSEYAKEGNSLFLWSFVFGLISVLLVLPCLALLVVGVAIPCMKAGGFDATAVPVLVGGSILILFLSLILAYVARFLEDFIVPIMYKRRVTASEAWSAFLPVLKQNLGRFLLYGVFYLLLYLCWGAGILLVVLVTCCIALCPMILPYLWAVVLLPMLVFFRVYSLDYLARYGEEFFVEMK